MSTDYRFRAPASGLRAEHAERRLRDVRSPVRIAARRSDGALRVLEDGNRQQEDEFAAELPPLYPEWLGGPSFAEAHGTRFAYVGGAMARGIASRSMVEELARCGCLGFFGAAGLAPAKLEPEIRALAESLGGGLPWGSNLIHAPGDAALEENVVDIYLRHGVRRISAAAFMGLTPAIVRCAVAGIRQDPSGRIVRARHVFAKISRPETAQHFLSPAPAAILSRLRDAGAITEREAELASRIPLCEDFDVEGDSGGHTDGRPLFALFPDILETATRIAARNGWGFPYRLGAAGGLGTPSAIAAAFAMGASHVTLGSVHQSCREAGTSERVKEMLAQAGIADFATAPSADMFELGSRVQVLKKGTLMAQRGNLLLELYRRHDGLDDIPAKTRDDLERNVFRASLESIWESTRAYFRERDPRQAARGDADPRHRMGLVFRWYLGNSSVWPLHAEPGREIDYQIWSGPALGSFNDWARGSFLEQPANRSVAQVALNLMEGAAVHARSQQLRTLGLPHSPALPTFRPEPLRVR